MTTNGILGGTFDVLHDGHHALLVTAFDHGDHVTIGITSDTIANDARNRTVTPYEQRAARVRNACRTYENIFNATFTINEIDNPHDVAVQSDADFLVISPEHKTHERAAKINLDRVQNHDGRLQIIEAPMVEDYQGNKISSTRIVNNEIDTHGNPQ